MVAGVGLPIVDFQLASLNQTQLLAQFQKTPSFSQSVTYYQTHIANVHTVDDLLKDRRLLTVALSAFQLEGSIDETGIIRKLLSEDPTQTGSLAQKLLDPRFRAFAQAFSSLRSDNGVTIQNPNSINAVIAGFQTNEFQKFIATTDGDPSVRQALFFKQTVQDTIDISDTAHLFQQFQQSTDIQQAVSSYKSNIGSVTSVDGLLNSPQVLDVALTAFNIDPNSVSRDTLHRILTEPSTSLFALNPNEPTLATDPLILSDTRFAQFAQTFRSLNTDAGAAIQSSASVNAIVTAFQTNSFATTIATNDSITTSVDFGSKGGDTITSLLNDFTQKSGITRAVSAYQNAIGNVRTVDDLEKDPQLLNVALGAFRIDPSTVSSDIIRQLLNNDPNAPAAVQAQANALLQDNANVQNFVKAFSSLGSNAGADFATAGTLFAQFQQVPAVQQAVVNFQNKIGKVNSVNDLINDPSLLKVALTAFNIDPTTVSNNTVRTLLTEGASGLASDPVAQFDPRFLNFAEAFGSLNTDKGAELKGQSSIDSIVTDFQSNLFAQTLATNDPATIAADFGTSGSLAVGSLLSRFQSTSGVTQAVSFYQANLGSVRSVDDLVNSPQLLQVALGAFNLQPQNIPAAVVRQLLVNDPAADPTVQSQATALLQNNPDVGRFVSAFGSLNTDHGAQINTAQSIAAITSAYQANQFQQSITSTAQEVAANPSLATGATPSVGNSSSIATITKAFEANQFQSSAASRAQQSILSPSTATISTLQILGNATLSAVTLGALGLPPSVGGLDVPLQQQILARANFDPSKLTDPTFLNNFINQFLANLGPQSGTTGTSNGDIALALFQSANGTDSTSSDPTAINLTGINLLA